MSRFRIAHGMAAVAVVAILMGPVDVAGAVTSIALACLMAGPAILARRGKKFRAAAWVASLYPFYVLSAVYAFWLSAWCCLGHRPRPWLDNPGPIMSRLGGMEWVLLICLAGIPISPVPCLLLTALSAQWESDAAAGRAHDFAPLAGMPLAWLVAIGVYIWDPLSVFLWLMD
jgi:hypothetical protein